MIQSKTTLKSLAQILNVSISTVSKSLANNSEISEETKLRVKSLAIEYNYKPNQFAVNLRKGTTKTIGVIIPNILNPFFAKVLIGLETIFSEEGYNIITSISHELTSKEVKCVKTMSNGHVDGLIMCLAKESQVNNETAHLNFITNQGLPIILFDRINEDFKCDKVVIDDFDAAFNATNYLIKNKKCKKIALVSTIDNLQLGKLRLQGYKKALEQNNIKINNDFIISSSTIEDFNIELESFLINKKVDAFLGLNEAATIGTINKAKNLGYNISEDFSIAGFCNQSQLKNHSSLIIVNQHAIKIGEKTAETMLKRLKKINSNFTTTTIKASIYEA